MQQGYAAILWVLAVLGMEATALGKCELTRLLQDKLQYEMRLSSPPFQKHYFPIDYTVQVQYEEVLKPSNITHLRNRTVSEVALQYLWFHVSSQAMLRIHEVLPEKHPSWKYTQELCQLFDALGKEYSKYWQVGRPWAPPSTPALATHSHVALHTPCRGAGWALGWWQWVPLAQGSDGPWLGGPEGPWPRVVGLLGVGRH
uniref:Interleukin 34 n=1 Tax=Strigops habroptila TaxID=2489341 RepID=A0A672U471_STRHB